jgi:hypothetical protein
VLRWRACSPAHPCRNQLDAVTDAGHSKVAVVAYLCLVAIGAAQAALLGRPGVILRGVWPYALALVTLAAVVRLGRSGTTHLASERLHRLIGVVAAAASLLSLWVVVMILVALPDHVDAPSGFYHLKVAITSPVGDHNSAAGLLLVGLVAAVLTATEHRAGWLATVVISLGLVATLSRGAAVVLLAVAAASWATAGRPRMVPATLTAAGSAILASILGLAWLLDASPPGESPVADGPVGASVTARLELAQRGVDLASSNPLLGSGFGTFASHAGDLPAPNDHAHQLFAHAAAEGGVVALLAVITLSGLLLVTAWRLPTSPRRTFTLLGGGALLAHAQVEVLGGLPAYELLIALLIGVATLPGTPERDADPRQPSADG